MTDTELAKEIKKGNVVAYKQLFVRYFVLIRRFLCVMLEDYEQACDLAQEIFMRIWINRSRIDESKSIKSFLYTIAKNEAINQLNRKKTRLQENLAEETSVSDSSSDEVEMVDVRNLIGRKVENMPPQRRKIFLMSRIDKMSNKEIAAALDLSVRTVEKHIELALKDLRCELYS